MVLRIWDDAGGAPGQIVHEEAILFTPVATGDLNAFGRAIYTAEAQLGQVFDPVAGARYWLNPMGDDDSVTWAWQFQDPDSGERRSRFGEGTPEQD